MEAKVKKMKLFKFEFSKKQLLSRFKLDEMRLDLCRGIGGSGYASILNGNKLTRAFEHEGHDVTRIIRLHGDDVLVVRALKHLGLWSGKFWIREIGSERVCFLISYGSAEGSEMRRGSTQSIHRPCR